MVKRRKHHNTKTAENKGSPSGGSKPSKIMASTPYGVCGEQLSAFGGLLALIKFLDLMRFEEIFEEAYRAPKRTPKLGHYRMVIGLIMLLFIGFNRLWHFVYIRLDSLVCGFFQLAILPAASTFWRYVDSLGINQANALLSVMHLLRERIWQQCGLRYERIHVSIDTTVETVYGNQQGIRKGYNPRNRGKKGYRPVLAFIDETREYLLGKLRKGETLSGEEAAVFIKRIKRQLPLCVKRVLFRADAEFFSWETVSAAMEEGFNFIIANKRAKPPFDPQTWYRPWKRRRAEFNSCIYQPIGWKSPVRFVAMRIPKELTADSKEPLQYELFEDDNYTYRVFCTSLKGKPHRIIAQYDKRADVENLVGEAKREGLEAIPSAKFKNNFAFFQVVMLAYNIWRYLKMMAQMSAKEDTADASLNGVQDNTIRIARLKLLLIAAKLVFHNNRHQVKYSIHDTRTPSMINFLKFLDKARHRPRPWMGDGSWHVGLPVTT
jgi:hypothetical protein